jgi:signal transduction histidine kinase
MTASADGQTAGADQQAAGGDQQAAGADQQAAGADEQRAAVAPEAGTVSAGRRAARISAGVWAAVVLAALAGAALTILARGSLKASDLFANLGAAVAVVAYATLGTLIVRRAGNLIGWLMLGESGGLAFLSLASTYAVLGVATFPGALPAARQVGVLAEVSFAGIAFLIAFMFLLFPTGKLPSRRWRPVAAAGLLVTGLATIGLIVQPRLVQLPAPGGISLTFQNPLSVAGLPPVLRVVLIGTLNELSVVFVAFLATAFVSLAVRYRTGRQLLRQQVKWLALAAVAFVIFQVIALLLTGAGQRWLSGIAYAAVAMIALFGIPAAMTLAILKHRLYEIDLIINRAVVYGLVSAGLTAVYAGIVLGIGTLAGQQGSPVLTIAAAVAVALLFQPVRQRARRFANRLVYGERATPYQVLSDFADDMAGQLDYDKAVDRMVAVLAGATGATRAEAWIRVGAQLRPVTIWPGGSSTLAALPVAGGDLPAFDTATRAVAVRHGNELLGALALQKPRNEPLTAAEDKLLQHLASQAGLVFRNRRLTAELRATIDELRASRRRLVEAQDAERRKIERNLHDGAQQQLVALTIQLGLLEESAEDPRAIRAITPLLKEALRAAVDDLRDLARGIYPPLLAEQGLVAALHSQVRKAPLPVSVEADGVGRYPQDTESTVYFCALEALQNVAKYAGASQAMVGLACLGGGLRFRVTDDGAGFDPAATRRGTGLVGMADRLAALGGTLDVQSQPGHGTTVQGWLPVPVPEGGAVRVR